MATPPTHALSCRTADVCPPQARAQLRARLRTAVAALDGDELVVLVTVAERLARGRKTYGPLQLDRDGRNFRREAFEELVDAIAYCAMGLLTEREGRGVTLRWPQPGAPSPHVRFATDAVDGGLDADVALRQLDLVRAALTTEAAG